jgi:hypothetical protein
MANIFYGVGIAAAATSAILFLIKPGSDIATEEELNNKKRRGDLRVTPLFSPDGTAGFGAAFEW